MNEEEKKDKSIRESKETIGKKGKEKEGKKLDGGRGKKMDQKGPNLFLLFQPREKSA
jgi:hypothetical protein